MLAATNSVFYLALDRLPLAAVAAIEFLPVVVPPAVAIRTPRNLVTPACTAAIRTPRNPITPACTAAIRTPRNPITPACTATIRTHAPGRASLHDATRPALDPIGLRPDPAQPGSCRPARWPAPACPPGPRLVVEPLGIAFAAGNAVLFAACIVLGLRVARDPGAVVLAHVPARREIAGAVLVIAGVAMRR